MTRKVTFMGKSPGKRKPEKKKKKDKVEYITFKRHTKNWLLWFTSFSFIFLVMFLVLFFRAMANAQLKYGIALFILYIIFLFVFAKLFNKWQENTKEIRYALACFNCNKFYTEEDMNPDSKKITRRPHCMRWEAEKMEEGDLKLKNSKPCEKFELSDEVQDNKPKGER